MIPNVSVDEDQADADAWEAVVESASARVSVRTTADVADGVEYPLDPATVTVTRLTALIWVAAVAAPLWFAMLMIAIFASAPPIVKPLLFAGLTVMTVFWTFWATWWPGVRYRYISYRTDVNGFTIRRGVLWRGVTSIPKARVQHTDVVQGPIQRRFGLSKLVIHTAGTQDASVSLSGLPYDKALPIRDFLIESDERDGV
jgi:membrane protein YdbS with pleckstrin-like domain